MDILDKFVIRIWFARKQGTKKGSVKASNMTGFSAEWFLEDEDGAKIKHLQEPLFKDNEYNKIFRNWIHLMNSQISRQGSTKAKEKLKKRVKDFKYDLLWTDFKCNYMKETSLEFINVLEFDKLTQFLNVLYMDFGLDMNIDIGRNETAGITDEVLDAGYELFAFLISCPDKVMVDWINFYKDLFYNAGTTTILQKLFYVLKIDSINIMRNFNESSLEVMYKRLKYSKISCTLLKILDSKLNSTYGYINTALKFFRGNHLRSADNGFNKCIVHDESNSQTEPYSIGK